MPKVDARQRFYGADHEGRPSARPAPRKTKLRSSITPGTVLIVLAGRFRGKRVVFLQQLPSGLLLVTGPYALNGVPLRRVNQAYVIATSKKLDISGVRVPAAAATDAFYSEGKAAKAARRRATRAGEDAFFAPDDVTEKADIPQERKDAQRAVDEAIVRSLDETTSAYLKAKFKLSSHSRPHEMKF